MNSATGSKNKHYDIVENINSLDLLTLYTCIGLICSWIDLFNLNRDAKMLIFNKIKLSY